MPQRHVVTTLDSLAPGTGKSFIVAGRQIGLYNVDGRVYAIDDICPHAGASLAEGTLQGGTVTCPWHFAEFDVTCGKVLCQPAVEDLEKFSVFVNGNSIEVEL
jgi:3-phenylpropionate/trans-cinnamate dioxygenase ferredoxin component